MERRNNIFPWEQKWKARKLKFDAKETRKVVTSFCSKYKIKLSTLVETFETIGIQLPVTLTYIRRDRFCTDTGVEIVLNRNINPNMFSHIVVIKNGVQRGYDLSGEKNKIIVDLKYEDELSCSFHKVKGYNIQLKSEGYITVNDLRRVKDFIGLENEIYEEIKELLS